MVKYCAKPKDDATAAKAKGSDLRVHFKNTWQVARAIRGMPLKKAQTYLEQVMDHKRCIPYIRFSHAAGRTPQAKEFGLTQGRWPRKSVELMQGLLKNAESNAENNSAIDNTAELKISHCVVQRAQKIRRRTYRAHGRVGAYMASPCHVEVILEKRDEPVPKPTSQALRQGRVKPPAHKRFGDRVSLDPPPPTSTMAYMPKGCNPYVRGHNANRHLSGEELENNIGGLPVTDARLRELFNTYDADGSGFLNREEVRKLYQDFDNFGVTYSDREIDAVIAKYAIGRNDGKVDFDEFSCIILSIAQR